MERQQQPRETPIRLALKLGAGFLLYFGTGLVGQLLLKHAMAQMPPFTAFNLPEIGRFFQYIFTTPAVGVGVALLALNFGILLHFFSVADLSVVGPTRALSYLFLTLLAYGVLGEHVSPLRWFGVLLITGGVGLILSTHKSAPGGHAAQGETDRETRSAPGGAAPGRPVGARQEADGL